MNEQAELVLLLLPIFLISLSVHEFAHGWVAFRCGDPTAKLLGRLTLNPLAHADFFGTFMLPILGIYYGLPVFGWAKPVPVDGRNLKNGLRDMALVAAAGPASNVVLALLMTGGLAVCYGFFESSEFIQGVATFMTVGIQVNVMLAIFNLLPLPPLDGFRIVQGFVSLKNAARLAQVERFGMLLLFILLFAGFLRYIHIPIAFFTKLLVYTAYSISH